MIIGEVEVRTPQEYTWGYDPDWRHTLCSAKAEVDVLPAVPIPNDVLMQHQYRYLNEAEEAWFDDRATRILMSPGENMYKSVIRVNRMYQSTGLSEAKDRLEALLLCPEIRIEWAAAAVNITVQDAKVYEKLFFNVRDEEGKLYPSQGLREYFAIRGGLGAQSPADTALHHKQIAFEGGAKPLLNKWAWDDPTGEIKTSLDEVDMYRLIMPKLYAKIESRLRFDIGIDGRTLALLTDSVRAAFADLRRNGMVSSGDAVSKDELSLNILQLMQPHMIIPDTAAKERRGKILEEKLESVKQSSTSGIADATQTLDNITAQIKK